MTEYANQNPILQIKNLSVVYGDKTIIKDVNLIEFDVTRKGLTTGQNIAFLGRSGRGKSTLFRALTALTIPTTGSILIPDETASNPNDARAVAEGEVGFVDQKYTLFRHKTVYGILKFALRKSSLSDKEKEEKISYYLQTWGLNTVRDKYRHEMSGGQRQRVAIIAQLLCSGHFLVLDEPFSGLDPINIEDVKNAFNLILGQNDKNTIIFSTHDIELACEIAQSIYIIGYPTLESGEKATYGTIVNHYDLRQMGLAWGPFGAEHTELARSIKNDLANS